MQLEAYVLLYIAFPPIPLLHWWLYLHGSLSHIYLEASTSQIERFQAWMHIMHITGILRIHVAAVLPVVSHL